MSHGKKSKRKKKKQPAGNEHSEGEAKLNNKPEHVKVGGNIEVNLPQDLVKKYDAASDKGNAWHRKNFFVAVVTAIIVAIYTTVAAWQGCSSKKAAEYAGDANTLNRNAVVSVQRAFVTTQGIDFNTIDVRDQTGTKQQLQFMAKTRNDGNTPAVDVLSYFNVVQTNGSEPTQKEYVGSETDFRKTTIGPKVEIRLGPVVKSGVELLGIEFPHSPQDVKKTVWANGGVFFVGWVAYRDVFPHTKLHITEFCQALSSVSFVTTVRPPTYGLNFVGCRQYNCTDEYCKNYQQMQDIVANAKIQ